MNWLQKLLALFRPKSKTQWTAQDYPQSAKTDDDQLNKLNGGL